MNTWRTFVVSLLIVVLPLSATASMAVTLSCPHQGLGVAAIAHGSDHAAMAHVHDHAAMAAHPDVANPAGHHACDCVHHCAGAQALSAPALALDAVVAPACVAATLYRSLHSDSSETPLFRPPIPTPAA